jgi:hypothetical protein
MALFHAVKGLFRSKEPPPSVPPAERPASLLEQIDRGLPLEGVAEILRRKWLRREFENPQNANELAETILPQIQEKLPVAAEFCPLLLGGLTFQTDAYYTDALYDHAWRWRQQGLWPVETFLFLSHYYQARGELTRGRWFLQRELNGPAGLHAALELHFWQQKSAMLLRDKAKETGEAALWWFDAVDAAELAYQHCARCIQTAQRLTVHGPPALGEYASESTRRNWHDLIVARLGEGALAVDAALSARCNESHTLLIELATLVRENAVRTGPDFAAVARCQPTPLDLQNTPSMRMSEILATAPHQRSPWRRVVKQIEETVLELRLRKSDPRFLSADDAAQTRNLSFFQTHVDQIQRDYDGYLPVLELDAELCDLKGQHRLSAEVFKSLLRKRPRSAYYAFRTAQALHGAGDATARRWFIHASRQKGQRWRDQIAASRAAVMAYEFEAAALREVPAERRRECAKLLADSLEEHLANAGPRFYDLDTAAGLALRIAHLRHLSFELAPSDAQIAVAASVANAYRRVDIDGDAQLSQRAPEEVFDPIPSLAVEC